MKSLLNFLVVTLLLTSGICQDTSSSPTTVQTTVQTTSDTTKLTTIPDTTIASTTVPTTSSSTTTSPSTTIAPTTPPPTTATPSTTQSPSPTPTTIKTTTSVTTIGPVPTTPEPPKPELGEWNVTDGNITCIRADLKVRFKIPIEDRFDYILLSPNATKDGSSCKSTNGTQELELRDSYYVLTMIFDKDGNSRTYVKDIKFIYRLPDVVGSVGSEVPRFSVQAGSSYLCNSVNNVDLENVTMEIMHIQLQSFGTEANLAYGAIEECEADNKVNDMVPIVVGCALLALVVVVLIAYFVGRRRSRQKGYQSV